MQGSRRIALDFSEYKMVVADDVAVVFVRTAFVLVGSVVEGVLEDMIGYSMIVFHCFSQENIERTVACRFHVAYVHLEKRGENLTKVGVLEGQRG